MSTRSRASEFIRRRFQFVGALALGDAAKRRRSSIKYLVLTIRKPTFDDAVRDAHYAFLGELRDRGLLEQSGPFTDRSGGAYVLLTDSLADARRTAERDPLHIHNCSTVTVHEWNSI